MESYVSLNIRAEQEIRVKDYIISLDDCNYDFLRFINLDEYDMVLPIVKHKPNPSLFIFKQSEEEFLIPIAFPGDIIPDECLYKELFGRFGTFSVVTESNVKKTEKSSYAEYHKQNTTDSDYSFILKNIKRYEDLFEFNNDFLIRYRKIAIFSDIEFEEYVKEISNITRMKFIEHICGISRAFCCPVHDNETFIIGLRKSIY